MTKYVWNVPTDFTVGQRIKMHPGTDRFMMGDVYGEVIAIGRKWVKVRMDKSGDRFPVHPANLIAIEEGDRA